jgi:hypothetical protein
MDCKYEHRISDMHEDIKDIKKDIKHLLELKWAIGGVIAFVSLFVTLVFSYFTKGE